MLGRLLVCAVAMGTAVPAHADEDVHPAAPSERPGYTPDTLPLLMQDQRTTWKAPAPGHTPMRGFDVRTRVTRAAPGPIPNDLASFDALDAPAGTFYNLLADAGPEPWRSSPTAIAPRPKSGSLASAASSR